MPELDIGPQPPVLNALLPLFEELSGARHFTSGVPGRIPPSEIAAWFSMRGIRPNSRILWYLTQLDLAWLRAMQKPGGVV